MKKIIYDTSRFFTDIRYYWRSVLLLQALFIYILVPSLILVTKLLMKLASVKYLQLDLLPKLIMDNPLVFLSALIILILVVYALYANFSYLIHVVYFLKNNQKVTIRQLLHLTLNDLRKIRPSSLLFLFAFIFIILPLSGAATYMPIISNLKIPDFVATVIDSSLLYSATLLLMSLIFLYIAYRLIYTLPYIVLRGYKTGQAIKASVKLTKKKFWSFLVQVFGIIFALNLVTWLIIQGMLFLQQTVDGSSFGQLTAIVILYLITVLAAFTMVMNVLRLCYVAVDNFQKLGEFPEKVELREDKKFRPITKWLGKISAVLAGLILFVSFGFYFHLEILGKSELSTPIIISHRGVSNGNGVQNTIPSLEATAKDFHPDMIEMDIHQTKDKQFVVFHDATTKGLTGVNDNISKTKLAQLTALTAKENGKSAKVPSFDDYYAKARQIKQKLLIEVKTDRSDNVKEVVDNFIKQYGDQVIASGDMVHSLNYDLVKYIREKAPKIPVYYTMAYNFIGVPPTTADGYSMEISTLNTEFVDDAHANHKKVNAWSTNELDSIYLMRFYQVDGLITDDIAKVKSTYGEKMPYSQQIRVYLLNLMPHLFENNIKNQQEVGEA